MSALLVSTLQQSVAVSPTRDHGTSHAIFTGKQQHHSQESRIEDHSVYKVKSICNGSEE